MITGALRTGACLVQTVKMKRIPPWFDGCHVLNRRCYSAKVVPATKKRAETGKNRHFVDFKQLHLVGGKGGNGMMSFLREPRNEWGGPNGGDGGNGGHIIFTAKTSIKSLRHLSSLYHGADGVKGQSKKCHGKNAEHTNIEVPPGTIFKDENGVTVGRLERNSDYFVGCRGGAGGKGNHYFLDNFNRAPSYAEDGAPGEDRVLFVELQTIAHAGLIGFPNAGKSTLLRAISRARPKVAAYPFTTLNPHVGIVHYDDYEQVAVADIPGLISGAHRNRGLGFSFLRHIQRCICLLYVIDLSFEEPWMQLEALKYELEQYSEGLSSRPHAVIGNKMDLPEAEENLRNLEQHIDIPVFAVSAKKRTNIDNLLVHLRELYDGHAREHENG